MTYGVIITWFCQKSFFMVGFEIINQEIEAALSMKIV